MTASGELAILRWLTTRIRATPSEMGAACAMAPGEVRTKLVSLESRLLVNGRQDLDAKPTRRYYFITARAGARPGSTTPGRRPMPSRRMRRFSRPAAMRVVATGRMTGWGKP